MTKAHRRVAVGGFAALLSVVLLVVADEARAGGKGHAWGKATTTAGIDPTTVPLIDGDFSVANLGPLTQLAAFEAHRITRGEGIVIAVLDGGFDLEHPDLASCLATVSYDAIDRDGDAHDMGNRIDDDGDGTVDSGAGHGTFVAGVIHQAAPGATILPVRVRDDEGLGSNASVMRGLRFARDMQVDVINLSISAASVDDDKLLKLIQETREIDDIPIIVSAGNDAFNTVFNALAISSDTLPVGAVDETDTLAPFSNWSYTNSMVAAPGVDLLGPYGKWDEHGHACWSGTSFAAGFASGAAALVRAVRPHLSAAEVYEHLKATSDAALMSWGWAADFGRINLYRAVTE